ncbi:MAG TPA: hemerythrin domain-containing protein [Candidatus Nitrosotenuis sp.]|nr:hemerythrin domain-containing protein [Candidatus Nitrosotenuis sp.]
MDPREAVTHFRQEHEEFLRFLTLWESALERAASDDPETRRLALHELIELDHFLKALPEHCREEEEEDARLQLYLDDAVFEKLRQQHALLEQMTAAFRSELRLLTTPPPGKELAAHGRELLRHLRRHIEFEEGLMKEIESGMDAVEGFVLDCSVVPRED